MTGFLARARVATVVATALAFLVAGMVAGAAGDFFVIGASNNSGASQSILLTTAGGASFTLKNTTAGQTGQFGWSSGLTGPGRGVYGRADSPDGYGLYAANFAAGNGAGAALYADGNQNRGLVVSSDGDTAIEATTASGAGLVVSSDNGSGIFATGTGFAVGIQADGSDALFGILALGSDILATPAIIGSSSFDQGIGLAGQSSDGTGVTGTGEGAGEIDFDCEATVCWDNAGGAFAAHIGVIGQTDGIGPEGYSRGVLGIALGDGFYGVYSDGDAIIDGNLNVNGTCTGCTLAAIAQNASGQTIRQGDALTATGVSLAADGGIVIQVAKAKKGDAVYGIADVSMALSGEKVTVKPISHREFRMAREKATVTTREMTVTAKDRKWMVGTTTAANGAFLRVITSGIFAYAGAAPASALAGDLVAVGDTTGRIAKAGNDVAKGASAGKYLGTLSDGRIVLFVAPS